ncbi:hypothetical protein JD844_021999 [Phrynosoma platyrhinos]|uniref:LTD domain-containing protein n=1 Tax=Phrynosoma platyrhinos TaxID=52577 RepID=A0ABQ7SUA8_PHRPL|nr:hypothetical protein JD844_021999 [Phrynosoma platyrhinos]
MQKSRKRKQGSIRFHPVKEEDDDDDDDDDENVSSPPQMEFNRQQPVITRVSMMFNPLLDNERYDTYSSSSPTTTEPSKQRESSPTQNRESMESPHSLLLLLHQRDLEIKGLKLAAQKEQSNRLNWILQELVRPRQKGPPKKSPVEIALQKEVDQLNNELKAVQCDHKKEIQELENQLTKAKLHVLHLEHTVRTLSAKSESTTSDERSKLANETFEFGSVTLSDEDKQEIITKLEAVAERARTSVTTEESSTESSRTESQLPSEQSSLAIVTSHKSDLTSSVYETKTTESSLSLPSGMEKTQQEKTPLKIVQVQRRGKFVRILNSLLNKEVDLSGYSIQQWVGGYPVSIYRFPNGTILPAQHHITVWAAAASLAHEQPSDELLGPRFFRADPGCLTVLYNRSAAEAYSDNLDLSVDKFILNDDDEQYDESTSSRETTSHHSKHMGSGILVKRRYTRHFSIDCSAASKTPAGHSTGTKAKIKESNKEASGSILSSSKPPSSAAVSESSSSSSEGDYFAFRSWKPILQEPETREFKTTLDTTLPMVSLIGQRSARSRYGFKYMTYIPTTTDLHLRRYCPAK